MKYTPRFFKESLPEWKRKKDPVISKLFYRRVSFWTASMFANCGISANSISYFSAMIGIISAICYILNNFKLAVLGAILINIWLILDCTDGNIARSIKAQPMGEFADSVSSYTLVALIFNTMGYYVYHQGGILFPKGSALIILLGALASTFDTLARLIYQKYEITSKEFLKEKTEDKNSKLNRLRIRIDAEIGMGGILPLSILLGTIFNFLDIVIVVWCAYYGILCFSSSIYNIFNAIKISQNQKH